MANLYDISKIPTPESVSAVTKVIGHKNISPLRSNAITTMRNKLGSTAKSVSSFTTPFTAPSSVGRMNLLKPHLVASTAIYGAIKGGQKFDDLVLKAYTPKQVMGGASKLSRITPTEMPIHSRMAFMQTNNSFDLSSRSQFKSGKAQTQDVRTMAYRQRKGTR